VLLLHSNLILKSIVLLTGFYYDLMLIWKWLTFLLGHPVYSGIHRIASFCCSFRPHLVLRQCDVVNLNTASHVVYRSINTVYTVYAIRKEPLHKSFFLIFRHSSLFTPSWLTTYNVTSVMPYRLGIDRLAADLWISCHRWQTPASRQTMTLVVRRTTSTSSVARLDCKLRLNSLWHRFDDSAFTFYRVAL